jgi:hypothetical protein
MASRLPTLLVLVVEVDERLRLAEDVRRASTSDAF